MEAEKLKQAILQEITHRSIKDEWVKGPFLDILFSIEERQRKQIIADLICEGWIIIANKSFGYRIAKDIIEVDEYCERRKNELITSFRQIKILKAHAHGDTPLFMQDFIIQKEIETEIEEMM
jgi:hypothetical protein